MARKKKVSNSNKHENRLWEGKRRLYKRYLYVMGGNCTLQPQSNGHPMLRPYDLQFIFNSKNVWSCMFFIFYKNSDGEERHISTEHITPDGYRLNEMYGYIMDQIGLLLNTLEGLEPDGDAELIGSGYFIVPDVKVDMSAAKEAVLENFRTMGCYDNIISNLNNDIKQKRRGYTTDDARDVLTKQLAQERVEITLNE